MRIQRVQPLQPASSLNNHKQKTVVDLAEYKRIKTDIKTHQPDAETSFDQLSQVLTKAFPWIIVLIVIYLAVQLSRALINGWLP